MQMVSNIYHVRGHRVSYEVAWIVGKRRQQRFRILGNGRIIDNTLDGKDTAILTHDQDEEVSKSSIKNAEWNYLIRSIAATLISSSVCPSVASTMLSIIISVTMPLVSLKTVETTECCKENLFRLLFIDML